MDLWLLLFAVIFTGVLGQAGSVCVCFGQPKTEYIGNYRIWTKATEKRHGHRIGKYTHTEAGIWEGKTDSWEHCPNDHKRGGGKIVVIYSERACCNFHGH